MPRRRFLQATGLSLALPALESLGAAKDLEGADRPRRLLLMTDGYGFYTPNFYPATTGKAYPLNDVIRPLEPLRQDTTLLGGLTHLNGHAAQRWVAAGSPKGPGFGDSLDQAAARQLSRQVPLQSLLLSTRAQATGGSYRNKVPVAMLYDPEEIFDRLFTKGDLPACTRALARQRSVLDLCRAEVRALSRSVTAADRERLEDYLNSIRETEQLIEKERRFLAAPAVDPGQPRDSFYRFNEDRAGGENYFRYLRSHLRFIELAFKHDLTRVAYLWEHGRMHGATHHGNRASSVKALTEYATHTVAAVADLLTRLRNTPQAGGGNLLDDTVCLWTAALGSAASHKGWNVPALLAGGGFSGHGQYRQLEQGEKLTSLYLAVLQQLGVKTDRFNDSARPLEV